jgi:hypothetical protein
MPKAPRSILRPADFDGIRHRLLEGDAFEGLVVSTLSLGAALEVCCAWSHWEEAGFGPGIRLAQRWAREVPLLTRGYALLQGREELVEPKDPWGKPLLELRPLASAQDVDEHPWSRYKQRMERSLIEAGFSKEDHAPGIVEALHEMADNVIQHSGLSPDSPQRGLVGFQVGRRCVTFVIVDVGRGVLKSLTSNPRWQHISTSATALEKAVRESASRRTDESQGNGFLCLLDALAGLNGVLRFRSGDAVLTIDGRPNGIDTIQWNPPMVGFQLTVECSMDGRTYPDAVPNDP